MYRKIEKKSLTLDDINCFVSMCECETLKSLSKSKTQKTKMCVNFKSKIFNTRGN